MKKSDDMFNKISDLLKSEVKTDTIIGQQFQLGEYLCVPVMSIMLGFAGMNGEGKLGTKGRSAGNATGEGNGAGLGMFPAGFLVTKGGKIQFIPAQNSQGLISALGKIPGLIETVLKSKAVVPETQKVR